MRHNRPPAVALELRSLDFEDDCEFRDVIESVTVTKAELAAIVSMPGYSIPEVRQYLRGKPRVAANRSLNADAALAAAKDCRLRLFALWTWLKQTAAYTSTKKFAALLNGKVTGGEFGR